MSWKAVILTIVMVVLLLGPADAEIIDKVVAYIDTEAITLSELEETHRALLELSPDISKREALNTMINRVLLLREAHRLRLEAHNDDDLLDDYIDMKVRAFIKIKESDIEEFYVENTAEFGDKTYEEARGDIEEYLLEKEVNYRIRRHLESLKEKAEIVILFEKL